MASITPARKAVKTSQLPDTIGKTQTDSTENPQDGQQQPATIFTVAMTALNFVAFLFSLLAVDLHYTLRRSAMGATVPGIMPRWLHRITRPTEPYETYYRTKQKKLMRMEAEEAFRLRNRTLVVLAASVMGMVVGVWYVAGRVWVRLVRVEDR